MLNRLVCILFCVACLGVGFFVGTKQKSEQPSYDASKIVLSVKNIVELAVIESSLHQVYDFSKDNLKLSKITIPFTKQQTIVGVQGTALFGFDVQQAQASIMHEKRTIQIVLPAAKLLSLDLDYQFLSEETTLLNRLTPEDRNEILAVVRRKVEADLSQSDLTKRAESRMRALLGELGSALGMQIAIKIQPKQID